jgi:hypothetical protein
VRISFVHGSAPKMPNRSDEAAGSSPCRSISSTIASMYDGVTMMMSGRKSRISVTCRSVMPPETGTTVQPSFSAP